MKAETYQLILIALIGATLVGGLLWRHAQDKLDIFEPLVWFAIAYGVMFVLRPLHMVLAHDFSFRAPLSVIDVRPGFTRMLIAALLGAIGFVAGYISPFGSAVAERVAPSGGRGMRWSIRAATVFAVVGLLSFAAVLAHAGGWKALQLLLRGRSSELTDALSGLSFYPWNATLMLIPASLMFLAIAWGSRNIFAWGSFVFLGIVILLRSVPLGDRAVLLTFAGSVVVFTYLRRGARPNPWFLAVALLCALALSTTLSDLRGRSTRGQSAGDSIIWTASHPSRMVNSVVKGPDSEMAAVFSAALEVIPRKLSYTYGGTIFGDLVIRPVPRALWPSKPEEPRRKLIGLLWPEDHQAHLVNPEFSVLLYFFWDFGYLGVIVGLAVFGVLARSIREMLAARPSDLFTQLFVSLSLWLVVLGVRNDPVDTLITAAFTLAPLVVIVAPSFARPEIVRAGGRSYGVEQL